MKPPKIGRPPKRAADKYRTPARQLGRISADDWAELQAAAQAAGQTFLAWALPALLGKARRNARKGTP